MAAADVATTVSPTYREEISGNPAVAPHFGEPELQLGPALPRAGREAGLQRCAVRGWEDVLVLLFRPAGSPI